MHNENCSLSPSEEGEFQDPFFCTGFLCPSWLLIITHCFCLLFHLDWFFIIYRQVCGKEEAAIHFFTFSRWRSYSFEAFAITPSTRGANFFLHKGQLLKLMRFSTPFPPPSILMAASSFFPRWSIKKLLSPGRVVLQKHLSRSSGNDSQISYVTTRIKIEEFLAAIKPPQPVRLVILFI